MLARLAVVAAIAHGAFAQSTATSPGGSTSVSSLSVSTAVPSATAASDSALPSQVELPPRQAWCPSEIFCAGELLQTLNVANVFPDQKTIVDKPTDEPARVVLAAFNNITEGGVTVGEVINFVNSNFRGEGQELEALSTTLPQNPGFLNNVTDPVIRGFALAVHRIWSQLIRTTDTSTLCDGRSCESSLIPLNHTFVVPGGRFREQYYWDSYWIVEGLLESELYDIARDTLRNFMDELDTIGFIPNGGRIYYLNRSQPPLFIQMLARYVAVTNDRDILDRALPLAERELRWWQTNRMINVTSSFTDQTHLMARYAVNNTAPRPESYLTDYLTANGPDADLDLEERSDLYAELASGAETGWDYTARWLAPGSSDLKTLNVRSTIPVDLNSILYRNHILLAELYGSNDAAASRHRARAAALRSGILDLFWDSDKLAFYDYNLKTEKRNEFFSVATFYPFWSGIIPDAVRSSESNSFGAFSALNMVLNRYNGTFPSSFVDTGLQWDAPNTWPPHQHIILQALRNLPSNVTSGPLPTPSSGANTFSLIPDGQLGLDENQLPGQPLHANQNSTNADLNRLQGTVVHGGNATDGEGWARALERQLANRYVTSALCSWYATGGSIPDLLPRLSNAELNVTQSTTNTGNMFEKFSNLDIDSAGRGGEYTVQAGFGWTNGVLLWVASRYGNQLVAPKCPNLLSSPAAGNGGGSGGNSASSFQGQFSAVFIMTLAAVLLNMLMI